MSKRWLQALGVMGTVLLARSVLRRSRALALADRVVVITGGSRGLGLVLAREVVARGAKVAICARDTDELERARRDLEQHGGIVYAATCDVTDRDEVQRFITSVEDDFGPIDVLVNNAGIIQVGPLESMTSADFDRALDVNLRGPLHAALAVLPAMRRRRAGRIVNIASVGGKLAVPHLAPYSTSKFALVGLSAAMRAELVKDGIYVTTVCPGLMRTGSPRHAVFKGRTPAEYTWFTIGDSNVATSISAERAARAIVDAFVHGDAELVISPQARLAVLAAAFAPSLVQEVMGLVGRLMPRAEGGTRTAVEGKDIEAPLVPSFLSSRSDEAALRNNET